MEELKPCPFCNGKAKVEEQTDIFFRAFVCRCKKCGVSQPYPKYESEELAIEAWNRRVSDESEMLYDMRPC